MVPWACVPLSKISGYSAGGFFANEDYSVAYCRVSRILATQSKVLRNWPVGKSPIEGILQNYRMIQRCCIKKFIFLTDDPIFTAVQVTQQEKSKKF
jgi:hypothetical protein